MPEAHVGAPGGFHQAHARRRLSRAEWMAAAAACAAAVASIAGFVPGLYRDPPVVVGQSHGYDVGNLIAAIVLGLGLAWSAGGSVRGRLVALGALGCLLYGYVTYAFLIVLNPATPLYIAVLGLGGWSLMTGLASVEAHDPELARIGTALPRRVVGALFLLLAAFFAVAWIGQIAGAIGSGQLPEALRAAGWPMNPVYVEDLAFFLPLLALTGVRLLRGRPATLVAVPLLVFLPLFGLTILLMSTSATLDGQAFDPVLGAIFGVVTVGGAALAWLALQGPARLGRPHARRAADGGRPAL